MRVRLRVRVGDAAAHLDTGGDVRYEHGEAGAHLVGVKVRVRVRVRVGVGVRVGVRVSVGVGVGVRVRVVRSGRVRRGWRQRWWRARRVAPAAPG